MENKIIKRIENLANDLIKNIDNYVPIIGNQLYTYEDGTALYPHFLSFIDKDKNDDALDNKMSITIPETVLNFLVKGKFKLILTTSPFDVLEFALDNHPLKPKGIKVVSHYQSWGQQDNTNELKISEGEMLVYHLLGSYEDRTFPKSEEQFLECLLGYCNENANSLHNLISKKRILMLGSGIPDWLFLLLWYPLMRTSGIRYSLKQERKKEHEENNTDFLNYLNSVNFRTEEAMNKFIELANKKFPSDLPSSLPPKEFEYDVFMSYKSEDKIFADKIFNHLTKECGLKVWYMDDRPDTSAPGNFIKRISEGIDKARVFMPVIGKNYGFRFVIYADDPNRNNIDPLKDRGVLGETYTAISKHKSGDNGLDFYFVPVWDMDNIDEMNQYLIQNTFDKLGLFFEDIKYSFTHDNRKIKDYMDFRTQNWYNRIKKEK